jgi:protein-disulfide isomerase
MERTRTSKINYPENISDQRPQEKIVVTFPSFQIAHYIMMVLLIVASFFLGQLTAKVKYLEGGSQTAKDTTDATAVKPSAKYSSFDDALKKIAKEVKLDENKLLTCASSGEKKASVDKDLAYGGTLGVRGTPAYFINGKFLGGAFPFEAFKDIIDKELAGQGSTNYKDYIPMLAQAYSPDDPQNRAFDPAPKKIDLGNSPAKGPNDAKVTIVEFSDFQCPYCKRGYDTMKQVLTTYQGKVRVVFKDFPLNAIHPKAEKAAEAGVCAADQNKFWEFHDKMFETQEEWSAL